MSERLSQLTAETMSITGESVEVSKEDLIQKRYLTTREASVRYGLSVSWFEHNRTSNENVLPFIKLNSTSKRSAVRYDPLLLDKIFAEKRFNCTSEYQTAGAANA